MEWVTGNLTKPAASNLRAVSPRTTNHFFLSQSLSAEEEAYYVRAWQVRSGFESRRARKHEGLFAFLPLLHPPSISGKKKKVKRK